MNKKLDAKIKQILQENDAIVVPRNISKGIDETLKSLSNKKRINNKKVIAAASVIIFLSITPLSIKALKDMFYTYIPSTGNIISTDSTIYLLEKTINKKIGSRKVTLKELSYDVKNKMIIVSVEGNGQLPSNEATIKINKYKLKSSTCNITKIYDTSSYASWRGNYFFEYDKKYNEKNVELEFTLDNGNKAIFNCKLSKAKQVNNISELGYSAFNKNIEITAIVDEENNKLYVTLLDNLPKENMVVNYGVSPYPTNYDLDRTIEGIITLKDRDGNISKGKLEEGTDLLTDNRYCIDITNLKKPFTLEIPSINIVIPEGINSSDIVELPIPTNQGKIDINKNIMINNEDEMFMKANPHVNIVSIQREGEYYTIELHYPDNKDREVKMLECVVVPAGNSITTKAENWFEEGLSGNISKDGNRTITFKLPKQNDDKLFIKVLGSEYEIKGPWKIIID